MNIDERYGRMIPTWCGSKTLEDHIAMGLCWSLLQYVERAEACPFINCYRCRLRDPSVRPDPQNLV